MGCAGLFLVLSFMSFIVEVGRFFRNEGLGSPIFLLKQKLVSLKSYLYN